MLLIQLFLEPFALRTQSAYVVVAFLHEPKRLSASLPLLAFFALLPFRPSHALQQRVSSPFPCVHAFDPSGQRVVFRIPCEHLQRRVLHSLLIHLHAGCNPLRFPVVE